MKDARRLLYDALVDAGMNDEDFHRITTNPLVAKILLEHSRMIGDDDSIGVAGQCTFQERRLAITQHSVDRLLERWGTRSGNLPRNPVRTIVNLLRHARIENLEEQHSVARHQKHGTATQYWRDQSNQWRFVMVMCNDIRVLVTIERPFLY